MLTKLVRDARELAISASGAARPRDVLRALLANDSFQILALQRAREGARVWRIPGLNHALRRVQTGVYGVEIGREVVVGHGVYFVHPIGITLGGDARIGDRVRFYGNNTVGTAKENGYPTLEDDVIVGAGARILGPVTIGRGAVIGANAVVLADVPPGAIAVGTPARAAPRRARKEDAV